MKKKNPTTETENVPICVYASYFKFIHEPDTTLQDIKDFVIALEQYAEGNFNFVSDNRYIRAELRQVRIELKLRHEKYIGKLQTLRNNSRKGGEANKKRFEEIKSNIQSIDNKQEINPNGSQMDSKWIPNGSINDCKSNTIIYNADTQSVREPNGSQMGAKCDIDIDIDIDSGMNPSSKSNLKSISSTPSAPSVASVVGGGEGFSFFERFKAAQKEVESLGVCEPLERIQGGQYSGYIDTLARFLTAQGTKERNKVAEYIGDFEKAIEAGTPSKLPEIIATMKKDPILCGRAVMEENAWKALKEWDSVRKKFSPEDISEIEAAVRNYPTRDKWNILQKACRDSFGPTINSPKAVFLSKFKKPKGNGN